MTKSMRDTPHVSPWDSPVVTQDAVKLFYQNFTHAEIARTLNKRHGTQFSRNAVIGKLTRMGHQRDLPSNPCRGTMDAPTKQAQAWTSSEIDLLMLNKALGATGLTRLIKRSANAIQLKAKSLGVKLGWNPPQEERKSAKPVQYVSPFPERVMICDDPIEGVPLMKAVRCQCREVLGLSEGDYVFCGKATVSETSSWCMVHYLKNVQPQSQKDERSMKRAVVYHGSKGSEPRAY